MTRFQTPPKQVAAPAEVSLGERVRGEQQIILQDSEHDLIASGALGEKAQKLLLLTKQGFKVPKFFVVVTGGSGELALNKELEANFDRLRKPIIARSSHPAEGARHSFSGVLTSYPNILTLGQTADNERHGEIANQDEFYAMFPSDLTTAYREMLHDARGHRATKYLQQHAISNFRPEDMNVIVMEQLDVRVFGMFTTSSQTEPGTIDIHYEIRDDGKQRGSHEMRSPEGGIVTYDRRTDSIADTGRHENVRDVLLGFGRVAAQIHDLFGLQQIEVAATDDAVYVLQSRTIKISDPTDIPRFQSYRTMESKLRAVGYGFFTLPILVVDALEATSLCHHNLPEYKSLEEALATSHSRADLQAMLDYLSLRRETYVEQLRQAKARLADYILVIKEAKDIIVPEVDPREAFSSGKNYQFLNELVTGARVTIRGCDQSGVRHKDWDHVEMGGVTVFPPQLSNMMERFRFDDAGLPDTIKTGDKLTVLSNTDGVFVWPEDSKMGTTVVFSHSSKIFS